MRRSYACWSLALLFVYYEVDRWVPLGHWNGSYAWPVDNSQFYPDLVIGAILIGAWFCFRSGVRIGMVIATGLLGVWMFFHLQSFWIPYVAGARTARAIAFHAQFLEHMQVLPRFGNHFPPDGEHAGIDLFEFPAFALCLLATVKSYMRKKVG